MKTTLEKLKLEFNEKTHEYKVNGVRLPSVTQIKNIMSDLSHIPPEVLRNAGKRGKHVHTLTEMYDNGSINVKPVSSELLDGLMYLKGYKAFRKDHKELKTIEVETPVVSVKYGYVGRLDRITQRNDYEVGDVKSNSRMSGTFGLQLAAYQRAKNELKIINWPGGKKLYEVNGRYIIHLTKKGTYNFIDEGYSMSLKQLKSATPARIAAGYILDYKDSIELFDRCHKLYLKGVTCKTLMNADPELYSIAKLIKEKDESVPWKKAEFTIVAELNPARPDSLNQQEGRRR